MNHRMQKHIFASLVRISMLWLLLPVFGFEVAVSSPLPVRITYSQAKTQAQETGKPILVYLHRDSCSFCQRTVRAFSHDATVKAALAKTILFVVDCGSLQGSPFDDLCNVAPTPTFKLLKPDFSVGVEWSSWDKKLFVSNVNDFLGGKSSMAKRMDQEVIALKLAEFERAPSASMALDIAEAFRKLGDMERALSFYKKAESLDPDGRGWIRVLSLESDLIYDPGSVSITDWTRKVQAGLKTDRPTPADRVWLIDRVFWLTPSYRRRAVMQPFWTQVNGIDPKNIEPNYRFLWMLQHVEYLIAEARLEDAWQYLDSYYTNPNTRRARLLYWALSRKIEPPGGLVGLARAHVEGVDEDGKTLAHRMLAAAYSQHGQSDEAWTLYQQTQVEGWLDRASSLSEFIEWAADYHFEPTRTISLAEAFFDRESRPKHRLTVHYALVKLCYENRNNQRGRIACERALRDFPSHFYFREFAGYFERQSAEETKTNHPH
ncbi:thioredoxin family protein [Sulfidibacter corallicola]|uniref:thioredoxin family protein n=1 Tax=Sulfidibacter corallicola TaxID=2818388 RepID=UPI001F19E3E7|nr:thioredoxin family protein [Sulfidibacter corallicola]